MGATRTDNVYHAIRKDLLSAQYQPGQWLKASELQVQFDASLSVVREALSRLAAEGLLKSSPQRGFRVVELSMRDLHDLTAARIEIESIVLRQSLEQGDTVWESQLLAAHHVLDRTPLRLPDGRVNKEWIPAHAAFHDALLAGCANARLRAIAEELRYAAEMYRMWSARGTQPRRDVTDEHRRLLEAALERDVEGCVAVLVDHIDATRLALIGSAETNA